MKTELLGKYAELEARFSQLEAERKALREEIVAELSTNNLKHVDSPFGSFTVSAGKTSWTYSAKVKELKEKLKLAEITEQEKGIAKAKVGAPYLVYKTIDEATATSE